MATPHAHPSPAKSTPTGSRAVTPLHQESISATSPEAFASSATRGHSLPGHPRAQRHASKPGKPPTKC